MIIIAIYCHERRKLQHKEENSTEMLSCNHVIPENSGRMNENDKKLSTDEQ
jgi:hypothetical protein